MPSTETFDEPILVGDVGGTNARFALVGRRSGIVQNVTILPSADFPDLHSAVTAYLSRLQARPSEACVAVAGPVTSDLVSLTNVRWTFSVEKTRRSLGLSRLLVVNDFLALAMAVPRLSGQDMLPLVPLAGAPPAHPGGTIAVVGPGTGLGVAAVIPASAGEGHGVVWTALATEGGHVGLAPETELETELLVLMRRSTGHVSAEAVLSGPGIEALHRTLATLEGREPVPATAAQILAGEDAASVRSVDLFMGMLGAFAGNVALTLGARGGVYLGGGVAQRLGRRLATSPFRQRFDAKGVMSAYLGAIPTTLITADQPTFLGAAHLLSR